MDTFETIPALRAHLATLKKGGHSIAFVPTMGSLHAGHMALMSRAAQLADHVVASIFVNPTQFGDPADLAAYPRETERDLNLLNAAGVSAVFLPAVDTIYPDGAETFVEVTRLGQILHGAVRPGHFRGVATVVTKLFNIVQPDFAVFGEKDYQQLQVIRTMVRDLHLPVEIVGHPTVRAHDGLALSSRNARLSPEAREQALIISQSLVLAQEAVTLGRVATVEDLRHFFTQTLDSARGAHLKGLDIAEPDTLAEISGPIAQPIAVMLSVEVGGVLLLDQTVLDPIRSRAIRAAE